MFVLFYSTGSSSYVALEVPELRNAKQSRLKHSMSSTTHQVQSKYNKDVA